MMNYRCGKCGFTHVKWDAWAEYNPHTKSMELSNVFDDAFCEPCQETCAVEEFEEDE